MMIWMALRIHDLDGAFLGLTIGHVIHTKATLILDDISLVIEFRLVHRAEQVTHAIGFHIKRSLEEIRGDRLVIPGPILIRRSVYIATKFVDSTPAVNVVLRALKHHVLKQMSETGSSWCF